MKTSMKLVLVFGLLCFAVQASYFDQLLNSTKLRGKTVINTTKGLDLGYEGGLTMTLGGRDYDLGSVGLTFNAQPEVNTSGANFNSSIKYSGGFSFSDATNTTTGNVTITGLAKTTIANNISYDNATKTTNIDTATSFSDTNNFVVRSGLTVITGRGNEIISVAGNVVQNGDSVKVNQDTSILLGARGVVTSNGTSLGAYSATSSTTSNTTQDVSLHHSSWLPDATFSGSSQFDSQNSLGFQNTVSTYNKSGSVDIIGYSRVRQGNGSVGVHSGQGMSYSYDSASSVNGTVTGTSNVYGIGKVFTGTHSNVSANSSSNGIFNGGHIYQVARNTDGPSQSQNSTARATIRGKLKELFKDLGSFEKDALNGFLPNFMKSKSDDGSYHSALSAGWRSGAMTTNQATSNTTGVTNTTIGGEYRVGGIDTKNWKPWSNKGGQTITASFKTTNVGSGVNTMENIGLSASSSADFQGKMAQLTVSADDEKYVKTAQF